MSGVRRVLRRALAGAGVLFIATTAATMTSAAARDTGPLRPGALSMTVASVTPGSLPPTDHPRTVHVRFEITNNTGSVLNDVTLNAVRGVPIYNQKDLDAAIAHPKPPSSDLASPMKPKLITAVAGCANCTMDLPYQTTFDSQQDADICECADAVYPLYFTLTAQAADGSTVQLASTQTYVPAFTKEPVKAQVGWVWPLLDRPHRLTNDKLFTDDTLAAEVSPGGRLDQLLSVVEQLDNPDTPNKNVPLTIVTDPELIDELAVMSGGYSVKTPQGVVKGTGQTAAATWLSRLRTVLGRGNMHITFTPYADPPIESLRRAGLSWAMGLPTERARTRVAQALGTQDVPNDVEWPANETISPKTLSTLVSQGTRTVVLDDKTLPKGSTANPAPSALAPIETPNGPVTAGVTSSPIEHWVRQVLDPNGPQLTALPELVATMALRVDNNLSGAPYIMVAPPRTLLSVDPSTAVQAIEATSRTVWSRPVPLETAVDQLTPVDHGGLHVQSSPQLGTRALTRIRYVLGSIPGLGTLLADPTTRIRITSALPIGVQRAESTTLLAEGGTKAATGRLSRRVRAIRNNVVLVHPTTGGAYTLGSKNSKLPVTINNRLPTPVNVVVTMTGAEGFSADTVTRRIDPNTTVQLRVPTHVDRVGLFYVQVNLTTPDGLSLSTPLTITVHSTALGTIGIVITIAAGVVLVAALIIRFVRRRRQRRRPPTVASPEAVPATAATT
jgi:hypothetical protein